MSLTTVRVEKAASTRLLLSQHTNPFTTRLHTLTPHASRRSLAFGVLPLVPPPDALREVLQWTNVVCPLLPVLYLTLLCLSVSS
eukprot:393611-Rhodomonas_salina.1